MIKVHMNGINLEITEEQQLLLYQDWAEDLQMQMAAKGDEEEILYYWIINAASHPELPGHIWKLTDQPHALPLYMNTYADEIRNDGPWFLPCLPFSPLSAWIFDHLETVPLAVLVKTQRKAHALLFDHFQELLECSYLAPEENSPKKGIYRYYDPRILSAISEYPDKRPMMLVCGPALSLHAWEPGKSEPIIFERKIEEYLVCNGRHDLSHNFLSHLWEHNQPHTIIGTLSGDAGKKLRSMPLSEAYAYVKSMYQMLQSSKYTTNPDIAFATALSLLIDDESWEDILEEIVLTRFPDCPTLEDALTQAIPIWEAERRTTVLWAK
jgi:hypothetical protein